MQQQKNHSSTAIKQLKKKSHHPTKKEIKHAKQEKRNRIKALMSSSLGTSPPGRFLCSKCQVEVGSAAALQNHVRACHFGTVSVCKHCGWSSDVIAERQETIAKGKIVHGKKKTFLKSTTSKVPIVMNHVCNERMKRRHCSDSSYRSTKK
jgi:hypothetical protein